MGEGESSPVGVRIQPLWNLLTTDRAVPSPVGLERVRVGGGVSFQTTLSFLKLFFHNPYVDATDDNLSPGQARRSDIACRKAGEHLRRAGRSVRGGGGFSAHSRLLARAHSYCLPDGHPFAPGYARA